VRIVTDEISVELPRALIGGLKRGPAEEVLGRVAKDYALLYEKNKKLKAEVERLEREAVEQSRVLHADAMVPAEAVLIENAVPVEEAASGEHLTPIQTLESQSAVGARREHDELSRAMLAAAQQAAREMRESARRECELMLKKASSRARDLERAKTAKEAELEELDALKRETCDRMRASLRTILPQLAATGAS
jgi:cell division septum initiation protein DivIVA